MRTNTATTMHVAFTLDATDWRTVRAERRRDAAMPRIQNACVILVLVLALFSIGTTANALVSPVVLPTWPHRHIPWELVMSTLTSLAIVLGRLAMKRRLFPPMHAGGALDLRFDDDGIAFGGGGSRLVPWRWIAGARDIDDAIVLCDLQSNVLVLPKRVFADRGAALWEFLEERLISRRGLVRRPDARRTIFNTAADKRPLTSA